MATLGEVNRVSISNIQGKAIFIADSCKESDIVITVENKRIIVYNVNDHQVSADWTVPGNQLSCPAVMYGEPAQLSVAFNKTTIYTWERGNTRVEKGRKTATDQAILKLWAPLGRSHPFIFYTDGSLSSTDDPSITNVAAQLPEAAQVLWNGQVTERDCNVFCLVYESKDKHIFCMVYDWQKGTNMVSCTKHTLNTNPDVNYTSYSMCRYQHHVYLFALEGTSVMHKICILNMHNGGQSITKSESTLPDSFQLYGFSALDDHQIAVVGKQSSVQGCGLGIWDTKYALMHSFKLLSSDNCHWLHKIKRWLFFSCADGLYMCTYAPFKTTLAAAVGMLKPGSGVIASGATPAVQIELAEVREMLYKLYDPSKTPKAKSFLSAFRSFTDWLDQASPGDVDYLSTEINHLIHRIANEKSFWPEQFVFQTLLDGHVLQGSHLVLLMPGLVEHKQTTLIHQLLQDVSYIPESVIMQALSYYIRIMPKVEEMETEINSDGDCSQCIYRTADAVYINAVLKLPYNDVFMVQSLREMEFVLIIDLLRYLSSLMSSAPVSHQTAAKQGSPSLPQVFDWCCMCIDAHLSQLMISAEAKPVILTLSEKVKQQMAFFKEIGSLDSILRQLKEKWNQKPKHAAKHYCIHTLHIY